MQSLWGAAEIRRRNPHTASVLPWSGLGMCPAPRLGKKDKPLRTSGIRAGNPKKPDPSLL
jgi:hypothetical protein